jgi:hypothetical protein
MMRTGKVAAPQRRALRREAPRARVHLTALGRAKETA